MSPFRTFCQNLENLETQIGFSGSEIDLIAASIYDKYSVHLFDQFEQDAVYNDMIQVCSNFH